MKAKIFGLAHEKCKNFEEVVKRVDIIEKLRREFVESGGTKLVEAILAEVLLPSLDAGTPLELES